MTESVSSPPPSELKSELAELLAERKRRSDRNKLSTYRPYPKQMEFHSLGATKRERLLMAGNQVGKSVCSAAEIAIHLTGRYPDWWTGRRFNRAVRVWVGSQTNEVTRDTMQRLLVGDAKDRSQWGMGMIPGDLMGRVTIRQGAPDCIDTVLVMHTSGINSTLGFKTYDQGRTKWQGETLDIVAFDEEPPQDIYTEGLTRTNATNGMVFMTFTPLLGMSEVVRMFMIGEQKPSRAIVQMTIFDAGHYTEAQRQQIIDSYPEHERDVRIKGTPSFGSGRIYPVAESSISIPPFDVPAWWAVIGGLDLGWDHPTAAVKLVHDRDTDIVYLTRCYRVREQTPLIHSAALRPWGDKIPWAWPHDAYARDKKGERFRDIYAGHGLNMLPSHAVFEDGSNSVEAGCAEILERMQTQRFKVFSTCTDWFEEFRIYHRLEGLIVKEYDDLMDATRYAIMQLRDAVHEGGAPPQDKYRKPRPESAGWSWMAT